MAYVKETIFTKPQGIASFGESSKINRVLEEQDLEFVRSSPGFISLEREKISLGKWKTILTFVDKESFDAMDEIRRRSIAYITKKKYMRENGYTREQ